MSDTAATPKSPPLDDVMLAMDVVDTLRHRELVVEREMAAEDRDRLMKQKLREIYRAQGIEVPDRILEEGVRALREERFVYKPPGAGLRRWLFNAYVARDRIGRKVAIGLAALGILWGGFYFGYQRPREQAAESLRIELTQTLPARATTLSADVTREALLPALRDRGTALAENARTAARDGNAEAARRALADLEAMRDTIRQEFTVRVVNRPGEQSGVIRRPSDQPNARRSYYLIVEAIGPAGEPLPRRITAETDGATRTVTRWGQRVPQDSFEVIRRDKADDGILQRGTIGQKRRGVLDPEWLLPVEPGAILEW